MELVEIGDIGQRYNLWLPETDALPEHGCIISGTREEIKEICSLLYKKVKVVEDADVASPGI